MYLLTKNLKTRTPSKKLDYIKVGPFFIKEVKGSQNFELDLPTHGAHSMSNVNKLTTLTR